MNAYTTMKHLYTVLLLCLVALVCSRCKPEFKYCDDPTNPLCPNYIAPNPCANARLVSAEFEMKQSTGALNSEPTTLISFFRYCRYGRMIYMTAQQENAQYHWIVGANDYFTREINFYFPSEFEDQNIPITLIVTDTTQSECLTENGQRDTVVKIITPRSGCNTAIWGKFHGAWLENPSDSFTVEIIPDPIASPITCFSGVRFLHLNPAQSDTVSSWNVLALDNYIEFHSNNIMFYSPQGYGMLDSSLEYLTIHYSLSLTQFSNSQRSYHVFHGKRVQ